MVDVTVEELKERIVERMDADELLEVLEVGIEELVEAFPDKIEDNYERLVQELFDEFGEEEDS
jgi:hypothetical protein